MFASSAYIEKGMFPEAIAEARKARELSGVSTHPPYSIAFIYNGLDERDKALAWLERGYEQRDPKMVFLKVESKWNNLRDDPRFQDLFRRVGFTQ